MIWIEGCLIVAQQRRRGRKELSLPGGRVNDHEGVLDALKREVAEETGLEVAPGQLLYVSEIVRSARAHDLELTFLAELSGVPASTGFTRLTSAPNGQRCVRRSWTRSRTTSPRGGETPPGGWGTSTAAFRPDARSRMESSVKHQHSGIQSVRRAAAILRALSTTRRLGVVELGHEVGMSKTTVFGILRTLELDGLVERDPGSGKYQLGASVLPMGFRYLEANALRSAARNGAYALAARSRESVRVARLHEGHALIVHQVSRPGGDVHASDVGRLVPAHATGLGKALLMQQLPSLALGRLRSFTPATITVAAERGPS